MSDQTPTPTGQDEARRALATKIEKAVEAYGPHHGLVLSVSGGEIDLLLAALRAPSLGQGAEEMRERAAQAVAYRGERARLALRGGCDGEGYNRAISDTCVALARSIRALPVPADLNEGGGNG